MATELETVAKQFSIKYQKLLADWQLTNEEAFKTLERIDPELASLAIKAWSERGKAVRWFGLEIRALGMRSPWYCLAQGQRHAVERALNAIMHGELI